MPGEWCNQCHAYHFGERHLPRFRVGSPEYDGGDPADYRAYHARDAEEAAEKYAEQFDSGGDYTIVGGSSQVVFVTDERGKRTRWRVTGEAVPHYHAEEID